MSDAKLRELERRWLESKCPEDEAAWLLGRAQGGMLEPIRLELAAYLGHEAAGQALGAAAPQMITPDLMEWDELLSTKSPCWGLAPWGVKCLCRLHIAIARALLSYFDLDADAPALARAEADLLSTGPGLAEGEIRRHLEEATDDHSRWRSFVQRDAHSLGVDVLTVLYGAYETQRDWGGTDYPPDDIEPAEFLENAIDLVSSETIAPIFDLQAEESRGRSREALRAFVFEAACRELVVWALGYGDPIRERIATR